MVKQFENELLNTIIEAISEKKGSDIKIIDLRAVDGAVCDWFVVCSTTNTIAVNAISDNVEDKVFEEFHQNPHHVHGRENSMWIAMDYLDIMVHIFLDETRDFYKLEELWGDCPITLITE